MVWRTEKGEGWIENSGWWTEDRGPMTEDRELRTGVRSQGWSRIHPSPLTLYLSALFPSPVSLSIQILQDAADTLALGFGGRGRRRFGVAVAGDQRAEAPLLSRVGAGNGRIGFGRLLLTN